MFLKGNVYSSNRLGKKQPDKREIISCKECGEEFEKFKYLKNKKFCSMKCYATYKSKNISEFGNFKGYTHTDEVRKSISEKLKNDMDTIKRLRMKRIGFLGAQVLYKRNPTGLENKLFSILDKENIKYETQKLINGKFLVDAYIPSLNLIIEVDGKYWHNLDRIKNKDKAENAYLIACGFNLLRIKEDELNKFTMKGGEQNIPLGIYN